MIICLKKIYENDSKKDFILSDCCESSINEFLGNH